MISRLAGIAARMVLSTTAVAALASSAYVTPSQMLRSRSRCPVLMRNATTAPTTRIASNPSRRMMRNDCQNASQPLPAGSVSATTSGSPASIASRSRSAARTSLARTAPLKSVKIRSIEATSPGFFARAGDSIGSNAM